MSDVIIKTKSKKLIFLLILIYINDDDVATVFLFLSVSQSNIEMKTFESIEKEVNYTCILMFYSFIILLMNLNDYL